MNLNKFTILAIFGLIILLSGGRTFPTQMSGGEPGAWYVTPSGDDNNSCDLSNSPCATIMLVLAKPEFLSGDMILVAEGVYRLGYDYSLGIQVNTNTELSGGWNDSFTSQDNTTILENKTRGITIGKTVIVQLTRFEILAISDLGIYNSGELYSDHLTLSSINDSAIYNEGVLSIDESMITQSGGCGIINDGSMAISNTRLEDNYGCGITNYGTMEIDHTTIQGSVLRWGCTGISNTGTLRISGVAKIMGQ